MSTNENLLSDDEVYLRVTAPNFFKELIDSHTATLVQEGNPEALTAWKQSREIKDHLFAELAPKAQLEIGEQRDGSSLEMQSVKFTAALNRLAAEYDMPVNHVNHEQAAHAYSKVLHEEWVHQGINPDDPIPAEDMQFVVNRDIEESKKLHHERTEPRINSFGKMTKDEKDRFMADQVDVGKSALEAKEISLDKNQGRDIDPPDHE
jgi:hypothetical protein